MKAYKLVKESRDGKYESWSPMGYLPLHYEVGKETKAHPRSVGIICFDSIKLVRSYDKHCEGRVILEVQGRGKPVRPLSLWGGWVDLPKGRWWERRGDLLFDAPLGTICFPSVTVLERSES